MDIATQGFPALPALGTCNSLHGPVARRFDGVRQASIWLPGMFRTSRFSRQLTDPALDTEPPKKDLAINYTLWCNVFHGSTDRRTDRHFERHFPPDAARDYRATGKRT